MCKLSVAIVSIFLMGAMQSAEANSADPTVFGIRLGEPLALPECSFSKKYGRLSYDFPSFKEPPPDCWKRGLIGTPGVPLKDDDTVVIQFESLPYGFGYRDTSVKLIAGLVEEFRFSTEGSAQQEVFDALVRKYGAPTSHDSEQLQNRMGASFASTTARWNFSNLSVLYLGLGSTVDKGILVISSTKATQQALDRAEKQKAAERQL